MKQCTVIMYIICTIGSVGFSNAHVQADTWLAYDPNFEQNDIRVTEAAAAATAAVLVIESAPEIVGAFGTAFYHIGRRILGMGKPQKTRKEIEKKEKKRSRQNQQIQLLKEWYQSHPKSIPEYIWQQVAHNKQQVQAVDTAHQNQSSIAQSEQTVNNDTNTMYGGDRNPDLCCDTQDEENHDMSTNHCNMADCDNIFDTKDDVVAYSPYAYMLFSVPDDKCSVDFGSCRFHKASYDDVRMRIANHVITPEHTETTHDFLGKRDNQTPAAMCCDGGSGKNGDINNACPCPVPCGCDESCKCRKNPKYTYENGVYEGASYHHNNNNGRKSPAPQDGQKALDNSVPIEGSERHRISVCFGEFVVLHMTHRTGTHGPVYHGHVRKYWKDLSREMQKSLLDAGLVKEKAKKIRIVDHAAQCPFCR